MPAVPTILQRIRLTQCEKVCMGHDDGCGAGSAGHCGLQPPLPWPLGALQTWKQPKLMIPMYLLCLRVQIVVENECYWTEYNWNTEHLVFSRTAQCSQHVAGTRFAARNRTPSRAESLKLIKVIIVTKAARRLTKQRGMDFVAGRRTSTHLYRYYHWAVHSREALSASTLPIPQLSTLGLGIRHH